MSAASALARGRAAAEALMVDTCTVKRLASDVTDGELGTVVHTYSTIFTGACKVQRTPRASRVTPTSVGQAEVFESRLEVHLPIAAVGVLVDDFVTITASVSDPDLVGKIFHIREIAAKTWQTARRYGVEYVGS